MPKRTRGWHIYTDGACTGNPGPGGWAAVLLPPQKKCQVIIGSRGYTTNQQMELSAVIGGLYSVPYSAPITVYTDSKYVRDGVTKWLDIWRRTNWTTREGTPVKNQHLWTQLDELATGKRVSFQWVPGHSGVGWNERADREAKRAIPNINRQLKRTDIVHVFLAAVPEGDGWSWRALVRSGGSAETVEGFSSYPTDRGALVDAARAVLEALESPLPIAVYATCDYLIPSGASWIYQWAANRWQTATGRPVQYAESWKAILELQSRKEVDWFIAHGRAEQEVSQLAGQATA